MLREQNRVKAFENRVPRRMFGSKREEIKRGLRKLHKEELHKPHFSPHIFTIMKSRRMRWVWYVACMTISGIYTGF
jgi:hypothetical protein